ncbi:hypothetical protein [Nocardia gipuzkoensis]|uniref:hypothetical protein n=1 Tax=Nocardia gipuzkoensis TaxID=2749991 RepID=UPI0015EF0E8A|nr:hypothetical protein [Nocardia gipuzkoensis]
MSEQDVHEWWVGLINRVGIDEALKVVETEQDAESGTVLLVEWLTKYVNRPTGVQDDGRRKHLAYIRNDITPFFGARAPLNAVTQDTDAAWIVYPHQDKGNSPKTIEVLELEDDEHAIVQAVLDAPARYPFSVRTETLVAAGT